MSSTGTFLRYLSTSQSRLGRLNMKNAKSIYRAINYKACTLRGDISYLPLAGQIKTHLANVSMTGTASGSRRHNVTDASWAADKLRAQGEKLENGAEMAEVLVTEELFDNPSEKVIKLTDEVLALNVIEVNQLLRRIQTRLGISDEMAKSFNVSGGVSNRGAGEKGSSDGGAPGTGAAKAAEPAKAKEAFDIKLTAVDAKAKIKIIKEIRQITGLGLKEAKELVEKAPVVIKTGVKKEEADTIKKALVEAGAGVDVM